MDDLTTKQSDELEAAHDELDKYGILPHDSVAVRIGFLGAYALSLEEELTSLRRILHN